MGFFFLTLDRDENKLVKIELSVRFIGMKIPMSVSVNISFKKMDEANTCIYKKNYKIHDFGVNQTEFKKSFDEKELTRRGLNYGLFNIQIHKTATLKENQSSYLDIPRIMLDFLNSKKCSDFIIQVDGNDIPVHKCILEYASPVFGAMLCENNKETKDGLVEIKNFDLLTIRTMIEFLYSRIIKKPTVPLAIELLRASDMYAVVDLQKWCCDYLLKSLCVSNAIEITIAAYDYNNSSLKAKCLEYILENKDFIKPDDKIKKKLWERKDLSMELFWKIW